MTPHPLTVARGAPDPPAADSRHAVCLPDWWRRRGQMEQTDNSDWEQQIWSERESALERYLRGPRGAAHGDRRRDGRRRRQSGYFAAPHRSAAHHLRRQAHPARSARQAATDRDQRRIRQEARTAASRHGLTAVGPLSVRAIRPREPRSVAGCRRGCSSRTSPCGSGSGRGSCPATRRRASGYRGRDAEPEPPLRARASRKSMPCEGRR